MSVDPKKEVKNILRETYTNENINRLTTENRLPRPL